MTNFRKGDIVSVQGIVQYDYRRQEGDRHLSIVFNDRPYSPVLFPIGEVTLVTPLLKIGDSVIGRHAFTKKDIEATIVFIHGEHIWVEESFPSNSNSPHQAIWRASDVTRVDPDRTLSAVEQPPAKGEESPAVAPVQPPSADEPGF